MREVYSFMLLIGALPLVRLYFIECESCIFLEHGLVEVKVESGIAVGKGEGEKALGVKGGKIVVL